MVLLAFILCGLAVGLVRGGSLRAMAQHNIALLWLPVAAYLCKAAGPYAARLFPAFASYAPLAVCLLHYGLLFIFVAANLRRGVWSFVFGAGAGMNFAVIALNGGAMPVSAHVLESAAGTRLAAQLASGEIFAYAPVTDSTRLVFLGDVLALEPFGRLLGFASIGDLVLGVGAAMLCFTMLVWNIGAEGQALIGALAAAAVVRYFPVDNKVAMLLSMALATSLTGSPARMRYSMT